MLKYTYYLLPKKTQTDTKKEKEEEEGRQLMQGRYLMQNIADSIMRLSTKPKEGWLCKSTTVLAFGGR